MVRGDQGIGRVKYDIGTEKGREIETEIGIGRETETGIETGKDTDLGAKIGQTRGEGVEADQGEEDLEVEVIHQNAEIKSK